ncbi:hypothetical protein FIBSPDRAFT_1044175 [Athelia psychrophila]|uniref:Uncharacterized protein n=1 Tax=Athelia psychrophila TaxID=1759441 RepID=A0A166K1P0_9AGAM|nr:hypothetical protein FIBSPDRAFT_1044175 [Fibularhizoctonia sp. CBS 109695]
MTVRAPSSDSNSDSDGRRLYRLSRVFSHSGPKICIHGTNYVLGGKEGLFTKSIQGIIDPHTKPVIIEGSPAGSRIGPVGIVQFLRKSRIFRQRDTAYKFNIRATRFSLLTPVQIAVEARNVADPPKPVHGLRRGGRLPVRR